jgi:pimeloyl-ACP methyl ester carboxylesterase
MNTLLLIVLLAVGLLAGAVAALVLFTAYTARRVEAALPPLGKFLDVDGVRLHYIDQGAGQPLLFIHGLGGQARHFTYAVTEQLSADHRVIVIDRPGSGHSTRPSDAAAGPRAQARTIAAFVRALGIEQPVVVGHSLGGAVALALALDHPDVVRALALVAPLTHIEGELPPAFAAIAITNPLRRWLTAWTLATPGSISRRREVLAAIFGPDAVPPHFATAGGGLLTLRPSAFIASSRDLASVLDDMPSLVARYHTLTMPVSLLHGTGDRILPHTVQAERLRERVPHLALTLVEGGHMLPLTAPAQVSAVVRDVAAAAR